MDIEFEEHQIEDWMTKQRRGQEKEVDKFLPGPAATQDRTSVLSDLNNILILVLLYCIQGVPLGLTLGSVPFLLQSSSSYSDIGLFSLAAYPYSMKLLWSPIVDSVFNERMGLRKSWIVPIQIVVGSLLVIYCESVELLVTTPLEGESHVHNIRVLTAIFFVLIFLVATQDIAVDGWALTMLSEKNRGLASTCQSVGQNIGFFMSYTMFLALSSPDFCNRWLRNSPSSNGMVTLSGYMWFWGWIMIVSTLLIWVLKTEKSHRMSRHSSIKSVYRDIWQVIQLPAMRSFLVVLLTARVAFAAADNVLVLKFIEKGFPRETMALMVLLSFPFDILLPIFISRWTRRDGNEPLHAYLIAFPIRIALTILGAIIVFTFPTSVTDRSIATYAYVFAVQIMYSFTSNTMFVAQCTFFAEISDVKIGGTYMTLLNTIANLGGTWPKYFTLYLVDFFTKKECTIIENGVDFDSKKCTTIIDGYFVMSGLCAIYGLVWWIIMKPYIIKIQSTSLDAWKVRRSERRKSPSPKIE